LGKTREVLDELLVPGNRTAMSALPEMLAGLNEVIPPAFRGRVLLRGDAHFGTVANLRALRQAGYYYLCPLYSYWSKKQLKEQVRGAGVDGCMPPTVPGKCIGCGFGVWGVGSCKAKAAGGRCGRKSPCAVSRCRTARKPAHRDHRGV
jgi:hypothetical protein